MAATRDDAEQLDAAIKKTLRDLKEVSAMQVWTWTLNREGNLLTIENRLEGLTDAGKLRRIPNSFPAAYTMGRWK